MIDDAVRWDRWRREMAGDIALETFFGEKKWVAWNHLQKHVEVKGASGMGKTTLVLQLLLGVLERHEVGVLLIDPKGTSVERWLGWLGAGVVRRPAYVVDLGAKILRYNPLACPREHVSHHTQYLWESLHRIRSSGPTQQHRQMARFVTATLRSLIEAGLHLSDAYQWLTNPAFRAAHLGRVTHPETRSEWEREPSKSDLNSTMNFFEAFWRTDAIKAMYSGDGWDWERVYDEQAMVLVNLRAFMGEIESAKAIGTMFVNGLYSHVMSKRSGHKLWFVVVEDATDYVPEHVSQLLTMTRELDLYLWLVRHNRFDGKLEEAVKDGARTKFLFGEIPDPFRERYEPPRERHTVSQSWKDEATGERYTYSEPLTETRVQYGPSHMRERECLYVSDNRVCGKFLLEYAPDYDPAAGEALKARILEHEWYGVKPTAEMPTPLPASAPPRAAPRTGPPIGPRPQPPRPGSRPGRRGK